MTQVSERSNRSPCTIILDEKMKIIAFTGMPFSGKSEAVKIAKEQGITVVRMGDMIWEETKKQGLELNDQNVGMIANNMRKTHGKDIWAKKTIKKINSMKETELLVIDGIRNIEEIETFEKELGKNFVLIAIEVCDKTRHKRALMRGRNDDSMDPDLIKQRDRRELSWGLGNVIAIADSVVKNEGKLEDFKTKIKKLLK
jgi:dephospho-CoA kinase